VGPRKRFPSESEHSACDRLTPPNWLDSPLLCCNRNEVMPKLKTHSGAAKRFKKTGTGKIKRGHAYKRHILTSKGTKRKRQLDTDVMLDKADVPKIKRMIPY